MKITFLHHSSFLVELEHTILLFDYFAGDRVNGFHFTGTIPQLDPEKDFYVFASHKHQDHFDMDNLKLAAQYPKVHFIFSKDCKMSRNFLIKHGYSENIMEKITYTAPEKKYEIGNLQVRTLTSTDAGVAFCVKSEGKNIYHAGDLNWWHWEGEDKSWNNNMAANFRKYTEPLRGRSIDLAMLPLDPRLGEAGFRGPAYFLELADIKKFLPMHQWNDFGFTERFLQAHPEFADRTLPITKEGQTFTI